MATRTLKLRGIVWGDPTNPASLTVTWNGTQVFSDAVTTVAGTMDRFFDADEMPFLCTWSTDTSQTGTIPLILTITNGDMVWNTIQGNYFIVQQDAIDFKAWHDGLEEDIANLDEAQFDAKHGFSKAAAEEALVMNSPTNLFCDVSGLSTVESDGHDNVVVDGVPQSRVVWEEELGKWNWPIPAGGTLTCDVNVVPCYTGN